MEIAQLFKRGSESNIYLFRNELNENQVQKH